MENYYIGLMSGTSMDGIDAALVSFGASDPVITLIDTASIEIPATLKSTLNLLCHGENIALRLLGETDTQMGHLFAEAVLTLLQKTNINSAKIIAIGSHGQTIYHHPSGENPFTLQIGDPNIIAAKTKITTVADFRRKDIALSGQGAPLVPAFHDYLWQSRKTDQWVVNIGGIANVTYLPANKEKSVIGFDTGPGNTLLDSWHKKHRQLPCDINGEWARSGKLNTALLQILLSDPYFEKSFPKSTGREYFNLNWLSQKIFSITEFSTIKPEDIQNTLTELTARTIADAVFSKREDKKLWLCGGGTFNVFLVERLRANLPNIDIQSTREIGIDPQWMEAAAFAWLAKQTMEKKSGNLPSVTGANHRDILGGIYFAL